MSREGWRSDEGEVVPGEVANEEGENLPIFLRRERETDGGGRKMARKELINK